MTSNFPEHTKLRRVADKSQAIGEFLEWVAGKHGAHLMTYGPFADTRLCPISACLDGDLDADPTRPCGNCDGTGFVEVEVNVHDLLRIPVQGLLAEFFEIDREKLETEKRTMLDAQRALNEASA